ncbi:hypothetical protein N566_08885 [Streptomycetaceae bacterium MP113-05]|nr:hypothetical protein N566_08885 [Streptomycetaceae bacterium MP113-05]
MSRPPLTFIVGTGRCGSTALSDVLRLHPSVLSLSELLTTLEPGALPDGPVDGAEFWKLLASSRPFADRMIREGTPVPEHLYAQRPGRFTGTAGVPALCLTTLPHLTDDPDALFDVLRPELSRRPSGPVAGHYRALFDALSARCGGHAVIERSGFSLSLVPRLRQHFPEARFVHLHRNGPDCALSMSRHPGYRLLAMTSQLAEEDGENGEKAAELGRRLADDDFDVSAALRHPLPLERFGTLWSRMITEGVAHLDALPADLRMSVAFEDVLADPERELTRLAEHIGVRAEPDWLRAAGLLLDAGRPADRAAPPTAAQEALRDSCAPGTRALTAASARDQRAREPGGPARPDRPDRTLRNLESSGGH